MTEEIRPGTILLDKFRVDATLGVGGMGVVLAATHLQLQERVAIKLLRPAALRNEEAVARFLREARAAVRLKGAERQLDLPNDDNYIAPSGPRSRTRNMAG